MKVVVLGPTGGTGAEIVRQALAAGYDVTAVVRRPAAVEPTDRPLRVVAADVMHASTLADAFAGADAVLSALGSREMRRPTTLYSKAAAAAIAAMDAAGVRRFIAISAIPVTPVEQKTLLNRYLLDPLLYLFFGGGYDDMRRMEGVLATSDVEWTVFRPPYLTTAPATGLYRSAVDAPLPGAFSVSRADLAAAMLAAVENRDLVRKVVTIAS